MSDGNQPGFLLIVPKTQPKKSVVPTNVLYSQLEDLGQRMESSQWRRRRRRRMGGAKAEQSEKVLELILASVWVSSRNPVPGPFVFLSGTIVAVSHKICTVKSLRNGLGKI